MRALFDIVHPAHVHFYRHLHDRLVREGHEVHVVAREKDVTRALLEAFEMPHEVVGRPRRDSIGQAIELIGRDLHLARECIRFKPDVVLTRNPAGVHAARMTRTLGIFDTDNGTSAGRHFAIARPFADIITSPACLGEDYGAKHRPFPSYKPLAFLHPNHFEADPAVRDEIGVAADEPYAIVRLVAMSASHDHGESGLGLDLLPSLVEKLSARMRVFVSGEAALPDGYDDHRLRIRPERMLDAIAEASLLVGDSGSMVGEAAVLGVPTLFVGSFAGRLAFLDDLEHRWGLCQQTQLVDAGALWSLVEPLVEPSTKDEWQRRRRDMLTEMVDVSEWYWNLLDEVV